MLTERMSGWTFNRAILAWFKLGSSGSTEVVGLNWCFDDESQCVSLFNFEIFGNSFCRYTSLESYLRLFQAFVFQIVYHLCDWS